MKFNPPPGWPKPPEGWSPPAGWKPDPSWPPLPNGWELWLPGPEDVANPGDPSAGSDQPTDDRRDAQVNPLEGQDLSALRARIAELESALASQASQGSSAAEAVELNDQRMLQDVGIYRYHHPLENAEAYKQRLRQIEQDIDQFVKARTAVLTADRFTFDGSLAKGRKMTNDMSKLMLRAYNAEADNCVRSLRSGNITTATRRLEAAMSAIQRLGAIMDMRVNPEYHALRVAELELVADYQMKVQEEREKARAERELLREQRRAEAELAEERARLEKERQHYESALAALRERGDADAATDLEVRLAAIDHAIEANDYRIANVRAGYVYVISNIGAFGPDIVKIGMTRRLDPMDRVRELGDASVPFRYDVHALFFADDAVALENDLHRAFSTRRVNHVNERREFFFATPAEVRDVLAQRAGGLLEFTEAAEAPEYYQSVGQWPMHAGRGALSQDGPEISGLLGRSS